MIRVAAVSYLNARPLVEGMTRPPLDRHFSVSWAPPSECARRLHEGEADLGLIPSIEYARSREPLEVVPGVAIGSRGPVGSVLLYTKTELSSVRSIALNAESRTSNALVTLLFAEEGARPVVRVCEPELDLMLERHDAAVLIGDAALFTAPPPGVRVIDLGEAWSETRGGLPFVYAFWAARPGRLDREDYRRVHAAKAYGRRHLREIATGFAWRGRSDPELCYRYLSELVQYRLGNRQVQALSEFWGLAARHGLIEAVPPLRFLPLSRGNACRGPSAQRSTS